LWIRAGFADMLVSAPGLRVPNRWCGCTRKPRAVGAMSRRRVEARLLPQFSGHSDRIKLDGSPPCRFIAPGVEETVVGAAQGNRKLVADPPAQCPRLCKSQMVGVGRPAPAQQARLRCHELQVRTIAIAARFAQREGAFIDMPGNGIVHAVFRHGAYDGRWHVILGQYRGRVGRTSATPRLAGILPCRVGRLVPASCAGRTAGESRMSGPAG
jgi:hypothetical protein